MINLAKTKGTIATYNSSSSHKLNLTTQLFGLPYQFMPSVDPPVPGISKELGRKYVDNIVIEAPVVTILPGKPKYLPGVRNIDKTSYTNAFVQLLSQNFDEIKNLSLDGNLVKLYDFQTDYIEYYQYVNILCRSCAAFLDLNETTFKINNKPVNFKSFDWKNYRWNGKAYSSMTQNALKKTGSYTLSVLQSVISSGKSVIKKASRGKIDFTDNAAKMSADQQEDAENILRQQNYIQFYVDSESGTSMSVGNETSQSQIKQMLDSGSSAMKEVAFLANSGGVDTESLGKLGESTINAMNEALGGSGAVNTNPGGIVSRLLSAGKTVVKGENFIMPDIWTGSNNQSSFGFTVHLKALYGNRLSLYMDVIVPLMHLIALTFPVATSANSYASPQLVKVYKKGDYTCNLGIVSSISIDKSVNPSAWTVDGMCSEIDVRLEITDLYSDIALTPANDPIMFLNNSSLVEYLATTCGLDMIEPQLQTKIEMLWNGSVNMAKDLPTTAIGKLLQEGDKWASSFIGL